MNVRIFDTEYKLILIIYIFNKDKLFFYKKFKIYKWRNIQLVLMTFKINNLKGNKNINILS